MAEVADRWHRTDRATGARLRTDRYGVGKRWLARWRDDTGAQRKRAFERKADAERFLVEVAADLARGAYVDPRAGRVTVREYAERWREAQVHRATTAAQVETHLRRHLYPTFGNRPLISVRPSEVQAWIRGLEQHLAPSTIGVVYSFLAGIFRAAVRDRATPGRGVRPRAGGGRLPARTLEVRQQLVTMPGQAPYLAPPKTPASYRTIPLPQVVVDALAAHLVAFSAVEVELLDTTVKPEPRRRRLRSSSPGPLVGRCAGPSSRPSGARRRPRPSWARA